MAGVLFGCWKVYSASDIDRVVEVAAYSLMAGALGGSLVASRYVVYAVRHGTYDRSRLLWQFMTPIQSSVLAVAGLAFVHGGLLALASSPRSDDPRYLIFALAFSFLVGITSEVFIKRLIKAAESLFGESGDLNAKIEDQPRGPRE